MATLPDGPIICPVCLGEGPCVMTKTRVTPTMADLCRQIFVQVRRIEEAIIQRRPCESQEPTITPEDTLRETVIDSKRQAKYQRQMSRLLSGRD